MFFLSPLEMRTYRVDSLPKLQANDQKTQLRLLHTEASRGRGL